MAKQSLNQLIAKFERLAKEEQKANFAKASAKQKKKTPEQMLAEEIQKITIKNKAKEATAKPSTRQELTAQRTKQLKTRRELQEEKRKSTPSEDILRFGKKRQEFRNLAYKTSAVQRKEDGENVVDQEGKPVRDLVFTEIPGNELFKEQAQAYGDSLKLAGLAQQYGARTPDIRKIDSNRKEIEEERTRIAREKYKQLTTQKLPLRPGADGTYSQVTDQEKMNMANDIANEELVKKYGKGILPLLTALKNR